MTRPLRIEYENAVYHVMNRGKGRANIFHGKAYTELFLHCLEEAHTQFGLEVLAYCFMNNHYHLLVRTPRGNLSRCMRHVNGVYTQRYNKLLKTDGPLFRGRYKAILVEADAYLLEVSRYIHRNPIETKNPLVSHLVDYKASSYPVYINQKKKPDWLNREFVLSSLNEQRPYSAYKKFVEKGGDEALDVFYSQKKLPPILGNKAFIEAMKASLDEDKEISKKGVSKKLDMSLIVNQVCQYFNVSKKEILIAERGAGKKNVPRRLAMYFCQRYAGATLTDIAYLFHVTHYSTVSQTIRRFLEDVGNDPVVQKAINVLSQDLTP